MITELTKEQEQKLKEYYQTYLSHGLSTEPANKEHAEKAISELYRKMRKEPPVFIWKDSPKACSNCINENQLYDQLRYQLRYQLSDQLRNQLHGQLYNQLENQLKNQLYNQLYNQLRNQLGNQLENQLYNQLGNQLWVQLENQYIATDLWGQFDLYWIAHYKFCFNELPVKGNKENLETLDLWDQIGKSCSFWYPYENICVISDRPEEIHLNDFGELHNESGKAIKFRDDFGVYSINGCQITEKLFNLYKPVRKEKREGRYRFRVSVNENNFLFSRKDFIQKNRYYKTIFNNLFHHYFWNN